MAKEEAEIDEIIPTTPEVPKILNGKLASFSAIVKSAFWIQPGVLGCEGPSACPATCASTFIAKNFLITAAHCTSTLNAQLVLPNGGRRTVDKLQSAWLFQYADKNGVADANAVVKVGQVTQYLDQRWTGGMFADPGDASLTLERSAPFDFAILYIPDAYDNKLPAVQATAGIAMNRSIP